MEWKMSKLPKAKFPDISMQDFWVREMYPGFRYSRKTNSWTGILHPSPTSTKYLVRLIYKIYDIPSVFVLKPAICDNPPHIFPDGSLCLYYSDDQSWSIYKTIADTIIPWTSEWLLFYEYWLATGKWLGPEAPHTKNKLRR